MIGLAASIQIRGYRSTPALLAFVSNCSEILINHIFPTESDHIVNCPQGPYLSNANNRPGELQSKFSAQDSRCSDWGFRWGNLSGRAIEFPVNQAEVEVSGAASRDAFKFMAGARLLSNVLEQREGSGCLFQYHHIVELYHHLI